MLKKSQKIKEALRSKVGSIKNNTDHATYNLSETKAEMLKDAKSKIKSPEKLEKKSAEIKANQLLGLEILSEVYMLAILNMILMGDGSSNILNKDSLKEFNGNYGFDKIDKKYHTSFQNHSRKVYIQA